jgi:hypothetical protein
MLEVHATGRAIGVIAIRLDGPARAMDGGAAAIGSSTFDGVAILAVALLLVLSNKATFIGATETAVGSIYTMLVTDPHGMFH